MLEEVKLSLRIMKWLISLYKDKKANAPYGLSISFDLRVNSELITGYPQPVDNLIAFEGIILV